MIYRPLECNQNGSSKFGPYNVASMGRWLGASSQSVECYISQSGTVTANPDKDNGLGFNSNVKKSIIRKLKKFEGI